MKTPCCDRWVEETGNYKQPIGGGFVYPPNIRPKAQIEPDEDGTWVVNGCCGGGCAVITGVKFCPFCGANVELHNVPTP